MTSAKKAPLVIVKGMAGTAKTFYSLAVGLEKVFNNPTGEYRRIIVCRPNAQFDEVLYIYCLRHKRLQHVTYNALDKLFDTMKLVA